MLRLITAPERLRQSHPSSPTPREAHPVAAAAAAAARCSVPVLCFLLLTVGCARTQDLDGKVVVVTGASSGIGKGVAQRLADEGAHVVLAARRTELIEQLATDCRNRGVTALAVTTDVAHEEDVAKLAQAAMEQFGRIDVWINNAGIGATGRFDEVPLEDQVRLVGTNLNGVIYGSHHALRQFRRQGAGTLINIGSVNSRVPAAYMATYNATKHGVVGLTDSIHQELRLSGEDDTIRVSTVMPWAIDTPFWEHSANYTGHKLRNAMMDPPEKVVDAIVATAKRPRKHVHVGWKVGGAVLSKRAAPNITDNVASGMYDRELQKGSPADATPGAVHEPMPTGTEVSGGVRARKREEDRRAEK